MYGSYLRWIGIALALFGFLFFVRRGLKRREGSEMSLQPAWLSDLEREAPARPAPSAPTGRGKSDTQQQVEMMTEQNPEQVAAQVRDWLNND